jgi:Lrp/AsnC family leucine-responsive transcriptional regulator
VSLDELDRRIVDLLVDDGRMPYRVLGQKVGLSASATADRVRALVRRGVIARFTAVVDHDATRRDVEAVVDLRLASEADRVRFERSVAASEAVAEAIHLTGVWDYQLRLACATTAQVDAVIRRLKQTGGVRDTQTRIVLHRLAGGPPAR